jgi:FG-GAP repeat/RTX calcium-binding nonapeptide repeat (4 copies)
MTVRLWLVDDRWPRIGIALAAAALLANSPVPTTLAVLTPAPVISSENVPAGLESAISTTLGEAYLITSGHEGEWTARNPQHDLEASFSVDGFEVRTSEGGWSFDLSVNRFGRQDQLAPADTSYPVAAGSRVEYRRPGFTEWYVNRPEGIEHGFTISTAPLGTGMVEVELRRSEILAAELSGNARAVVLVNASGDEVLQYQDLVVYDARGNELPAVMELGPGTLSLVVDDRGAAYPITIDPLVVTEEAHLFASDAAAVDLFGSSVALSGDTALVGALADDSPTGVNAGSAYVFVRNGTTWTEQAHLVASDGEGGDQFGQAVSVAGDIALIGAYGDDTSAGVDAGSAYVFVRNGTTWTEQAHLVASDGAEGNSFGLAVAIAGETALVGATPLDDSHAGTNAGSAYVFVRSGTTWTEQAHLVASDGEGGDQFGRSVAVAGDTALIGAYRDETTAGTDTGSAYVFVRSGTTWIEQAHLVASDGAEGDRLGRSVAVAGHTALIGAPADDTPAGPNTGSAYVFVRSGSTWTEQAHLIPSDEAGGFGSVAVAGDTALIGDPTTGTAAGPNTGSAYVFARSGSTWTEQAHISASDGNRNDLFGGSVAVTSDLALVGADADDTDAGPDAGSVYVFTISAVPDCTITGTEGDDVLIGTEGDDVICGLGGNDRLYGLGGNDILLGGDGNDILDGGTGTNILDGEEGIDTVTYARAASAVTVNLATGTASGPSTDSLVSIENIIGSNFDDRLAGDSGDNVLNGSRGIDRLSGGPGTDTCINGELVIACEIVTRRQAF